MQIEHVMLQIEDLPQSIVLLYGVILLHEEAKTNLWLQEVVQKLNLEHFLMSYVKVYGSRESQGN